MQFRFDNSYAALPPSFYTKLPPTPVKAPQLIAWNQALAEELGLKLADDAALWSGNQLPIGASPLAQIYAGHQFGSFNPQLGDGRAILLGEVVNQNGQRQDLQLKGAGPTPYSRNGDGRAALGPVLREYIVSEAMHAFGIPSTRALAAVTTGEKVHRPDGTLPGAILTRVAASHLRVGTFELFASRGQKEELQILTQYAIDRHYPQAKGPMGLLSHVVSAQAKLVAQWMGIGFIHGVMNTDNCAISGETIDYGPCAFMDAYDPMQVFSSIDHYGRYAYANQPQIAIWNMAQLANALIAQMEDIEAGIAEATEILSEMDALYQAAWLEVFAAKIGIADPGHTDRDLIVDLLEMMQAQNVDFTNCFAALHENASAYLGDCPDFETWQTRWDMRKSPQSVGIMKAANPVLIPRNHQIEALISAALSGDFSPFKRMSQAVQTPYTPSPAFADLRMPPTDTQIVRATFCGT